MKKKLLFASFVRIRVIRVKRLFPILAYAGSQWSLRKILLQFNDPFDPDNLLNNPSPFDKGKMKYIAACLLAVFSLLMLFPAASVSADIAPPPAPHGGDIVPETVTTNVRMVAERVLIEALPNAAGQVPVGRVSADFQMRNMGEKEEAMTVRFPLNLVFSGVCEYPSRFKTVQDFQAWVNDQPASVTVDRRIPDMGNPLSGETDCWAYFPAAFPAGKDVKIRVTYTQEAGPSAYDVAAFVTYPYVLQTGAGWYDTIGSADITFRAPWELSKENLINRWPEEGQVVGNEVRWHFQDFEPREYRNDIDVTIVNPAVWREVVRGRRDTTANPQDGEAWGRLGKALKEMTLPVSHQGVYREDYFRESYAAYQKAVALRPGDADWHYGFAELLYSQVNFYMLSGTPPTDDFARDCFNQLKAALAINPSHEKSVQFLYRISQEGEQDLISKYGMDRYLESILPVIHATETQGSIEHETEVATFLLTNTPTPSTTPHPVETFTPEPPTVTRSATPSPIAISQLGATVSPTPVQKPPTKASGGSGGMCGSIIIPLIMVTGVCFWRRR